MRKLILLILVIIALAAGQDLKESKPGVHISCSPCGPETSWNTLPDGSVYIFVKKLPRLPLKAEDQQQVNALCSTRTLVDTPYAPILGVQFCKQYPPKKKGDTLLVRCGGAK